MLEKMKSISNPLTIIGLFCGVVEVAGLIVMGTGNITPEAQRDLVWLIKWFPIALISLFFITLWFKDKALYAPGDFKDEKNYLELARANVKQGLAIEKVQTMIAEARTEIISEVMKTVSTNGTGDRNKVEEIVKEKLQPIQVAIESVKSVRKHLPKHLLPFPDSFELDEVRKIATDIWMIIQRAEKPLTLGEVALMSQETIPIVDEALSGLVLWNKVKRITDVDGTEKYTVSDSTIKMQ
jgi:hypothetical protein